MPSFKLGFVQGVWRCHKWDAVTSMGYLQRSRFVACMTVVLPVKKYVNTRSWRLLCKHAYLNNTKTVNLIKKFYWRMSTLVRSWQIYGFFFLVGRSNLQWLQQKGLHLLPITHTHTQAQTRARTHKCGCIIFGRGCVYSVSVLIIRYLVRGVFFMRLEHYKVIMFRSEPLHDPV